MTQRDQILALQSQLEAAQLENAQLKLTIAQMENDQLQKKVLDLQTQVTALTPVVLGP